MDLAVSLNSVPTPSVLCTVILTALRRLHACTQNTTYSYLDIRLQRFAHDDFKHVLSFGVIGCYGDRLQQLVVE